MYRKQKSLSHTSRPTSYWIIGEQQASEWESTAERYIYSQAAAVRVRWLLPTPTPKKLAGSASISGMVSGKSGVDMSSQNSSRSLSHILMSFLYVIGPKSYRIRRNNAECTALHRSRSFKITDFGNCGKPICEIILTYLL